MDEQDQVYGAVDPLAEAPEVEEQVAASVETQEESGGEVAEATEAVTGLSLNCTTVDGSEWTGGPILSREEAEALVTALGDATEDADGKVSASIEVDDAEGNEVVITTTGLPEECAADVFALTVPVNPMELARDELGGFTEFEANRNGELEFESERHDRRKGSRKRRKRKKKFGTAFRFDRYTVRHAEEMLEELAADPSLATMGIDPEDKTQVNRAADTVSSLFEIDPTLVPIADTTADLRHQFFSQLLDTPDFHNLRRSTKLDEVATMITAPKIMQEIAAIEVKAKESGKKPDEMEMMNNCSNACQQAKQEVETFNDIRDSLGGSNGCGTGSGSLSALDAKRLAALFRQVSGNSSLRRILNLAGRYRNLARGRQRKKTKHGRDEVVGVTLGGQIDRMLAGEMAKLASPECEWDTMRRLADGAVMVQELNAVEKIAKGPVMAFIDESGSMGGDRIEHAKAIAISLAWVAKRQKRWCCLCAFSGDSDPDSLRKIALPPSGWSEEELLEWIIGFDGGGTTIDWLREESMDKIYKMTRADEGKTDLLIITDACVNLSGHDIKKSYLQWAGKTNTRLMAIEIAGGGYGWGYGEEGDLSLQSVCDEYHKVGNLGVEEEAVGDVLSI